MRTMVCVMLGTMLCGHAMAKGKTETAAPKKDPMMEAMVKITTPGPQHKLLKSRAGTWTVAGKFWFEPAKPPTETLGTAEIKVINDLWVSQDDKGSFMGKPFSGHGIRGYDLTKQKFVGSWADNMGSYIMNFEGTADATGKIITGTANDFDPMTMKPGSVKEITNYESDSKHTVTIFKTGPDGKEVKQMELVYTRKP